MKNVLLNDLPEVPTSHSGAGLKKVIIKNGEIPHLTQYGRVVFQPGEVATEHNHPDMYEIFRIESGEGSIKLAGNNIQLKPGMCLVAEPGEKHEITNTAKVPLIISYFGITVG